MVYDKARTAIEKQMRAMDPTPGEAAIAAQMKQLEEAISRLESENSVVTESSEPAVEAPASEPVAESEAPVLPEPEPEPGPESEAVSEPESEVAPEPSIEPANETAEELETDEPPVVVKAGEVAAPVADSQPPEFEAVPAVETESQENNGAAPQVSALEAEVPASESDLVPSAEPNETTQQDTQTVAPPSVVELEPAPRPHDEQSMSQSQSTRSSGGAARFIGKLLPYVLALMVLGGGAYALWLNKAALVDAFENYTKTEDVVSVSEPVEESSVQENEPIVEPEPEAETSEPESLADENQVEEEIKEAVRLGENGEDVVADPVEPDTVSGQTEVPLVLDPAPEEMPEPEAAVEPVAEPSQSEEEAAVEPVAEPSQSEEEAATTEPTEIVTPAVGDTAYLYEEGGTSEGAARSNAGIIWALGSESPEAGLPEEAVITAQLDVPEKALTMNLKIKRNTDEALSASHIIELIFTAPESFTGGGIDNVARFVMKSTEQARGEGLIAVPVRIDAGYFLIALNNLEQAVETNTKLLLESAWIDIPLGYTSGRRALVTFEKGASGEQIFKDAFEDWKKPVSKFACVDRR